MNKSNTLNSTSKQAVCQCLFRIIWTSVIRYWHLTDSWEESIWRNIWKTSRSTILEDSDITRSACWKQYCSDLWRMATFPYGNWRTSAGLISGSCILWSTRDLPIVPLATSSMKYLEIPSKKYSMTSIIKSSKQNMWIFSICTSTVPSSKPMQTSIRGYGRRQRKNQDTACLTRSRHSSRKSMRNWLIRAWNSASIPSMRQSISGKPQKNMWKSGSLMKLSSNTAGAIIRQSSSAIMRS